MNCHSRRYIYYSGLPGDLRYIYYVQIKSFTKMLALEYSGFSKWFDGLFENDHELSLQREIIICEENFQIAGISILKRNADERKICTLRVDKRFRRLGIGRELIELSFQWLGDEKPLITVQGIKEPQYRALFNRYGFKLEQENRNYYRLFSTELAYNGELPSKKMELCKIEMIDLSDYIVHLLQLGVEDVSAILNLALKNQVNRHKLAKGF